MVSNKSKQAARQFEPGEVKPATLMELMRLFACSQVTIHDMTAKGVIVQLGRNQYDATASTTNYIRHLRDRASNAGQSQGQEAVLLKRANRELAEAKLKAIKGETIDLADAQKLLSQMTRLWRAAFLALPMRIRVGLRLSIAQEEQIEKVVDDRLNELADETAKLGDAFVDRDEGTGADTSDRMDREKRPLERAKLARARKD